MSVCSVSGCERIPVCRGWCNKHYQRWCRHGDPRCGSDERGTGALERFIAAAIEFQDADRCLIWPFGRSDGYATVKRSGKTERVHRIICAAVRGPAPKGADAAHSCGCGADGCVNPHHLRWASRAQNVADMVTHGTAPKGERHGRSKLTRDEVVAIFGLRNRASQEIIAAHFDVHETTVSRILSGATWKSVLRN